MTKTFTASNGVTIEIQEDGYLLATKYRGTGCTEVEREVHATGSPSHGIDALREYFADERETAERPWRIAEPGEVWVLELRGYDKGEVYVCKDGLAATNDNGRGFVNVTGGTHPSHVGVDAPVIEGGFPLWPERNV